MSDIDVSIEGPVATVRINRPERRNALTREMRESLSGTFLELDLNRDVRVVHLTGTPDVFCTGSDVGGMELRDVVAARQRIESGAHVLVKRLATMNKPVVASVSGYALGLGLSLMLASDLVVAASNAKLSCIFGRRGLAPDSGTIYFLARLVGFAKARELVFTSRFFTANEALQLGIVNQVVEPDQLAATAERLVLDMASQPTYALAMAKKMLAFAVSPNLDAFLDYEAMVYAQINQTQDFQEGIDAFREKRPAVFKGR